MPIKQMTIGVLIAFASCDRSVTSVTVSDIAAVVSSQMVSEAVFLEIQDGSSLDTVRKTVGNAARHEFTVAETDGEYTVISCIVSVGGGVGFMLLFHDKSLARVIKPVPPEVETVPYDGTTWDRTKAWDIDDTNRIGKAIAAPALTHDQIRNHLDHLRPKNPTASKPDNIMAAFLLKGYTEALWRKMKRDYETNSELLKQYDGCRVSLGMTVEQVDALYGAPLRVFSTKDGRPVRVYGDNRKLEVSHLYRFSCVAIVLDKQAHVTSVYSHEFFNDEWSIGANR